MSADSALVHPHGRLTRDGWDVVVEPDGVRWRHTGLRILRGGHEAHLPSAPTERLVVPVSGAATVTLPEGRHDLAGRATPFDGPCDVLYVGPSTPVTVRTEGVLAIAEAPATEPRATRLIRKDEIPVELRGAGRASRQVHNAGLPDVLDAERLLVCEVLTPAGCWSSFPAHKHDEDVPGTETALEEIYWFELRPHDAPASETPFALFSGSGSGAGGLDVTTEVRSGDVVLVPHGFHGPAVAPPDADLYYLNVMGGAGPREWRTTDDPSQTAVRERWPRQAVDPRLPFGAEGDPR